MWQRFTERARKAVFYAQEEAGKWNQNQVSPEHLLLGLVREEDSMAARILDHLGVKLEDVRKGVQSRLQPGEDKEGEGKDLQLTPAAKQVIDFAYDEAKRLKDNYIGGEHLLLGILREKARIASETLMELGVTPEGVCEQLEEIKTASRLASEKPSEELLTLDEAVKFLGTSKPTLYRLLGLDEIKGLKVGRQWRFRKADLTAYMERSPVAVTAAPQEDLDRELAFFSEQLSETEPDAGDPETKTVRLAHKIIQFAIHAKASDIHLEPTANDFLLRYRVDGVLQEIMNMPARMRESLTAQFKIMADMEVNEKRLPQDGRIPLRYQDKDFDLRVAVLPSMYGEAMTMHILAKQDTLLGLDNLGLVPEDLRQIRDLMQQPNGIVIATGPTGSGKTTLLYSCLQEVADVERKTMTVEDPIEFVLPYVTQTQVNKKAGLTFSTALRALWRQDPDVILVGEVRDLETAQITVEASLTGHLTLTAMYTNDAVSALLRLLDMGLEPCLVSATVRGAIAVRLCRRLCENCKQPMDLSSDPTLSSLVQLAAEGGCEVPHDAVFLRGIGCDQCRNRGYRGRMGLYEVLTMTEPLTEAILRRAPWEELTEIAVAGGMRTLLADGIRKAVEGQTSLEEVLRVAAVSVSTNKR